MKRKDEFKAFLAKRKRPIKYVGYCERIEEAFGGIDMDTIIVSHQRISKVRQRLEAVIPSAGSVSSYLSALNAYLEFAFSGTRQATARSSTPPSSPLYHVSRAEGVPFSAEVEIICRTLEQEYASIARFANRLLMKGAFGYVPIVISKEAPMRDSPQGGEKVLGRFFPSSKPYIEIYHRNLDSNNVAEIRQSLAHEYFHYLHYAYAQQKYSDTKKELKEGLADFFGVLYSIHRKGKDDLSVAKKRYDLWKKNIGSYWPYANALHFCRVGGNEMNFSSDYSHYTRHGCVDKFVQVFDLTQHPDDAYKAMLNA